MFFAKKIMLIIYYYFIFQMIRPIYETFLEKHLKNAAEQAAQQAVSNLANGKVKSS